MTVKVRTAGSCQEMRGYSQNYHPPQYYHQQPQVCSFWRAGRCTRNPCAFLHCEIPPSQPSGTGLSVKPVVVKRSTVWRKETDSDHPKDGAPAENGVLQHKNGISQTNHGVPLARNNDITLSKNGACAPATKKGITPIKNGAAQRSVNTQFLERDVRRELRTKGNNSVPIKSCSTGTRLAQEKLDSVPSSKDCETVCREYLCGKCSDGDKCRKLHAWSTGNSLSHVATLSGHQEAITGIALPSGNDKLFSGSKDKTLRVWDCSTAECVRVINMGAEVGTLISEGAWIFVGVPNAVKGWNIENGMEVSLVGFRGQVYALACSDDMLFAGTQEGSIVGWSFGSKGDYLEPSVRLTEHRLGVVSLCVGAGKLYSGSMDHSIKEWDLATLACINTVTEHADVVMSLICWRQYLLSCSLDKKVKVWGRTEDGGLQVVYTNAKEHGLLMLCGMHDPSGEPILFTSCNDNSLYVSDLPSFYERGRIFSNQEFRSILGGPDGLFFTGDRSGELKVWRLLESKSRTC